MVMGEIVDLILVDIKKEIVKSNKLLLEQLVKMNELLEKNNKLLDDINFNVQYGN